ncbi:hypothetical protein KOI35_40055 [Actinoplanes bogorensis]|uniref:Uncharacterized protein n=1 Tax=Paractinoplanes bogorensis TaxID=1610840 RepID=A0ABS5Z2H2_9ACTN|nr:hypothetical protein [Actinoplanes bogorensis]MBU2669721.1 hypothetical protein [Actinoplanes bogorensis]
MHRFSPRHGLAVCAALGLLALTAACSSDDATDAAAANPSAGAVGATASPLNPPDPSVAAAADAALSGNTKAICAQAQRARTTFGEQFVANQKLKIDNASKDAAAKKAAADKSARDVNSFSYALADMAGLTTDAPLKKALTDMSAQVKALKGDVGKLDTEKMDAFAVKLDKACGKA